MSKNKDVVKVLKKSMRMKVLMLLGIMLTFNTFAWFVYSNTVNNSISTYVKAWRIEFEFDEEIVENVDVVIDELYPGMPEFYNVINIVNYGDTGANLTYEIVSLKVLENLYTSPTYTSAQLEAMLDNNYPFLIDFVITDPYMPPLVGSSDFEITANWAYESGNDVVDTTWGHDSYLFKQNHPGQNQIEISVKLHATQAN